MKIAVFSDIHGNLEALNVAKKLIQDYSPHLAVCLGDIVGYGPNPAECIDEVRSITPYCVAGNHDFATVRKTSIRNFNDRAKSSILWTSRVLSEEARGFLAGLPERIIKDGIQYVHSSPLKPLDWPYILSYQEADDAFPCFDEPLCFIGHSHYPYIWTQGEKGFYPPENQMIMLDPGKKHIINVGSVGQPRDHNPKGCMVFYDSSQNSLTYIRFIYEYKKTQQKIIEAGLPKNLANRLAKGI
ncbi:metallophosphoesterase family protein [bacterium]|nr:metallophosphoesterase family protein [bacterium]